MITPNLATKAFLNARPVWLVTIAAGVLTVVLVVLNVVFYLSSNRTLAEQIAKRDRLLEQKNAIEQEVRQRVEALDKVPWNSLAWRVNATNVILRERGFSWLEMLEDVGRVMPYEVRFTKISPAVGAEGVTLSLEVVCRNRDALLELLDNMIADPRFSEPTPKKEEPPDGGRGLGYLLSLTVGYHPAEAEA